MSGARLRKIRKQMGLTQEQLAERSDVSRSYLAGIETGQRPGSLKALNAIANALGVGIEQIFSGVEVDDEELQLVDAFRSLSPADKRAVLRHAEALAMQEEMRRIMK